jgi:hypothetical protein
MLTSILDAATGFIPWWSAHAASLGAVVGFIGLLFRFRWIVALVPVAGPFLVWGVERLWAFVKFVGHGLFGIVTGKQATPLQGLANICAALFIAALFLVGGLRLGVKVDAHLVREARERQITAEIKLDEANSERRQWKERLDEQDRKARDAETALAAAEARAKAALAKSERDARRLRDVTGGAAKAGSPKSAGPGLPGLSELFGGGK